MYGFDAYSRLMQQAGGQGNPDYRINADASMGNFNPDANSGNDGTIGSLLSMALSSYGPVGGAVGGAVGAVLDSGSKVSGPGEDRGLGQSVAQGAMKGALGNLVNDAISSPQLGDAFKADQASGQALAASDSITQATSNPLDKYPGAVPSNLTDTRGTLARTGDFATQQLHGATQHLFDPNVTPTPQTEGFTLDNVMKGYSDGASLGKIRANLGAGNFGSAIGGGAKFVSSNYKPPAYDADKYKQKYMIRY